jgi:hypothetical protein
MSTEVVKPLSKAKQSKYYINNRDFTNEIIRCKHGHLNEETGYQHTPGELSPRAVEYFILLANRAILKLSFSNPLDKEDCIQSALLDLLRYWRNFNEEKSNNAFAYFTQIAKNGYAKEYKKIYKHIGKGEKVEFVSLSFTGESEIYTI